ncbi:family 65 glycosyl hydrolase [Rhodococcus antarcticus]|uniref:Family 65 glycosyl hydrolase n=1 Tax=Rhodococcus antarcticus TaxID=2987751 RepID=A0ABY6P404_9NOCA|nr:glycosyl hydrolase family 65 protein [Rhodococcus antarcticus]UZJ25991.1 family 65 glycosyl hydrolase [Rhodococcus antarcticus]
MIGHPACPVEPWCLRATSLDLGVLAQFESLFALSNGHLGWRGTLDEGEPVGLPGAYLAGVFELRPLHQAEAGFGYPEAGQTIVGVTDGTLVRLTVDSEPFDVRRGVLHSHEQVLDLRAGTLRRTADWTSPAGRRVVVRSERLVSLTQRGLGAVCWSVQALDGPVRVVVQSELGVTAPPSAAGGDPRSAAGLTAPLVAQTHTVTDGGVRLLHRTRLSGLLVGAGTWHDVTGPPGTRTDVACTPDVGRTTVTATLAAGQQLGLTKLVAHAWSGTRSGAAVLDEVDAALVVAQGVGWDGLLSTQRTYLDDFWDRADVVLEGDDELQQAVRVALFHVLQAGARAESRAIGAKGLTGPGYDGHTFWDTEIFVLPVLDHVAPQAAEQALRWRHTTLPLARDRARVLGLAGAAFPWRTIRGEECSGYWPAGTAAFHIGADIAHAVLRYVRATGDTAFEATVGVDLVVETARLWASLGHHDGRGGFRIEGVTGPDEYSALVDNNLYTNLMAQQNLTAAAHLARAHPGRAAALGVTAEERTAWEAAAAAVVVPYDEGLGIHLQDDAFCDHERWDFAATPAEDYPLLLHHHYVELYRRQVVKQADLVLAMQLCSGAFTDEEKRRNVEYYEAITVRDSSLSAAPQAVLAAEVGHLELAYDYLAEASLVDLHDLQHNTRDGLHLAALAGCWTALVVGFGGMRDDGTTVSFTPRLPPGTTLLTFCVAIDGHHVKLDIIPARTRYTLLSGPPVTILDHGTPVVLDAGIPVHRPPAAARSLPAPQQPTGRAPVPRAPHRTQSQHRAGLHGGGDVERTHACAPRWPSPGR